MTEAVLGKMLQEWYIVPSCNSTDRFEREELSPVLNNHSW